MLIAQITDLHISDEGAIVGDGFDPAADLIRIVDTLNALNPAPAFVIVSGDLVDRRTEDEYRHLRRILEPLRLPLYIVPGNHDAREPLKAVFPDHAYLRTGDDYLQYAFDQNGLRFIGLDSLKPGAVGGEMDEARLAWLAERLAEKPQTPTFIFMHHPPFRTGMAEFDKYGFDGLDAFRALVEASPQIERIVCGHIHRTLTTRLGRALVSVCPSTTYAFALTLDEGARLGPQSDPPGFHLHLRGPDDQWITYHMPLPRCA